MHKTMYFSIRFAHFGKSHSRSEFLLGCNCISLKKLFQSHTKKYRTPLSPNVIQDVPLTICRCQVRIMLDVMLLKRGAITGTLFRNVNVISKGRVDGMRSKFGANLKIYPSQNYRWAV